MIETIAFFVIMVLAAVFIGAAQQRGQERYRRREQALQEHRILTTPIDEIVASRTKQGSEWYQMYFGPGSLIHDTQQAIDSIERRLAAHEAKTKPQPQAPIVSRKQIREVQHLLAAHETRKCHVEVAPGIYALSADCRHADNLPIDDRPYRRDSRWEW